MTRMPTACGFASEAACETIFLQKNLTKSLIVGHLKRTLQSAANTRILTGWIFSCSYSLKNSDTKKEKGKKKKSKGYTTCKSVCDSRSD